MENVQKVQAAFTAVYDALEKGNKAGVFTLAESSNIFSNTLVLKEYLQSSLSQVVANLQKRQRQRPSSNTLETIPEEGNNSSE